MGEHKRGGKNEISDSSMIFMLLEKYSHDDHLCLHSRRNTARRALHKFWINGTQVDFSILGQLLNDHPVHDVFSHCTLFAPSGVCRTLQLQQYCIQGYAIMCNVITVVLGIIASYL